MEFVLVAQFDCIVSRNNVAASTVSFFFFKIQIDFLSVMKTSEDILLGVSE